MSRYSLAILFYPSELKPVSTLCHQIIRRAINGCFFCAILTLQVAWGQTNEDEPRITWEDAVASYQKGEYKSLLPQLNVQTEANPWNDTWWHLKGKTLMSLGRYEEAYDTLVEGLTRRTYSISLRLLAIEAARFNNKPEEAQGHIDTLSSYFSMWARRVRSPDALVELGEVAIQLGVEPRIVLENFYNQAQSSEETTADAFLAPGRLALTKGDYRLASKHFQSGLEKFPEVADLWYGLAASFLNSDRSELVKYAQQALTLNENHVPSMLLMAEHLIDAEAYPEASAFLEQVLTINPVHPDAFALLAVIAYLKNDATTAGIYRDTALSTWHTNPKVDYTIGKKLSQKYWFAEGAEAQQRALDFDPAFAPAKLQLAQDLLRLGEDHNLQGWDLAKIAHDEDPYNVEAFNLVTLSDKLDEFVTLESEHFYLKMGKEEAPIYGQRASELLERAYTTLSAKYGVELDQKTTVEIYPNPGDFGVRTFGMPGNPGYLGVCFGPVVTVNSPATRQANWESVLWHEFCHTITLKMTRNRMPRWLSEGISVYEELEENPAWGRRMTVEYREKILDKEAFAISEMSAAFLQAGDDQGIQFAYFQSYLVVKFLFETYGETAMQKVLHALGDGINTNEALEKHVAPLKVLDRTFSKWARDLANEMGGSYELSPPQTMLEKAISAMSTTPSYQEALEAAGKLIEEEKWEEAKVALENLIDDTGYIPGDQNAHGLLAYTYQKLGETENERNTWLTIAGEDAHDLDAVTRLLELAYDRDDWTALNQWSDAWLAINPLAETPWRGMLKAGEELNNRNQAITAGETLVQLDPNDIASIHFRLARQFKATDRDKAHRQALKALEEAPRYREAYQLLKTINEAPDEDPFIFGFKVPPVHD
jgi:hypothetical protein